MNLLENFKMIFQIVNASQPIKWTTITLELADHMVVLESAITQISIVK